MVLALGAKSQSTVMQDFSQEMEVCGGNVHPHNVFGFVWPEAWSLCQKLLLLPVFILGRWPWNEYNEKISYKSTV
jgi:hypothetical protein